MKSLEEKKLLVKWAKAFNQPVDSTLIESIEREEKLAKLLFKEEKKPEPPPVKIFKEESKILIEAEPVLPPPPPPAFEPPPKDELIQQVVNVLATANTPSSNNLYNFYRDKEIEGIRKTVAEMMQKISTMSWGGGGTGIVRIWDADDLDRAAAADDLFLKYDATNKMFTFDVGGGGGGGGTQGAAGPQGAAGIFSPWTKITSNTAAVTGNRFIADTTGGSFVVTLPATPSVGHYVVITDGQDWSTNNLFVARNGSTIEGISDDLQITNQGITVELIYDGTTWEVTATLGQQGVQGATGTQGTTGPQGPEKTSNTYLVTTSTYTLANTDYYVGVNAASNVTITIPSSATAGREIIIKDESGNCANNPITVSGPIDNDPSGLVLQVNNKAVHILFRGNYWRVI